MIRPFALAHQTYPKFNPHFGNQHFPENNREYQNIDSDDYKRRDYIFLDHHAAPKLARVPKAELTRIQKGILFVQNTGKTVQRNLLGMTLATLGTVLGAHTVNPRFNNPHLTAQQKQALLNSNLNTLQKVLQNEPVRLGDAVIQPQDLPPQAILDLMVKSTMTNN